MKAAHRNIKPCCKLPYYSRLLNNCTCTIILFQPNFPYERSLLGTIRLLLWTIFLCRTFILNWTINHFEHVFSNCFNKKKHSICYHLRCCEVPHNLKENDIRYSVIILKSVSPGYHFNKNALRCKSSFSVFAYWTSTVK